VVPSLAITFGGGRQRPEEKDDVSDTFVARCGMVSLPPTWFWFVLQLKKIMSCNDRYGPDWNLKAHTECSSKEKAEKRTIQNLLGFLNRTEKCRAGRTSQKISGCTLDSGSRRLA
jgi:hypothetical protein